MSLADLNLDKTWTLFLDRDGVINHQRPNDYVKSIAEFKPIDGAAEAVGLFSKLFGRILIVTNQQGINKGIMTETELHELHDYMLNLFDLHGGKIAKIYFAPQLATESGYYRKPGIGMGLHAKRDFPDIDFAKSVMIGDSETDIEFGRKLGMKTVLLKNGRNVSTKADYIFENLHAVAQELKVIHQ